MNILNTIRRNWFWALLITMLFTISFSRNLPALGLPKLSWWNTLWILVPAGLSVWAGSNSWFIFRPIRWFQWPMAKEFMIRKIKQMDKNPLAYPALLWIECNGQKAYVESGMKGVTDGMLNTGEQVAEGFKKLIEETRELPTRHITTCCDGNCGCHPTTVEGGTDSLHPTPD